MLTADYFSFANINEVKVNHFLDELGRVQGFVVLAKGAEFSRPPLVKFFLVFNKAAEGAGQVQSPRHFASGPKAGKGVFERIFHFAVKINDHFFRLEWPVSQIGFALGEDGEGAFFLEVAHIDTGLVESDEDFEYGIFVGDVQAALVLLEALNEIRYRIPEALFVGLEKEGRVVT